MKKLLLILLVLFMPIKVYALGLEDIEYNEDVYQIVSIENNELTVLSESDTFTRANRYYNQHVDEYENIGITKNGQFYKVKYGVVSLKTTNACDFNVEFKNDFDKKGNYVNGCYGNDGAYIDSDIYVGALFEISGVKGWAEFEDVTIYPLEFLNDNALSNYTVKNGNLYHQVKGNISSNQYMSLINLGSAPAFLNEGSIYYSYDGHYFYNDMHNLLDDLKNDSFENAVNDEPYYNYYQYVSHRTYTNIDIDSMNDYFTDTLGIQGKLSHYSDKDKDSIDDTLTRSQYYGEIEDFYVNQYEFGANAAMMLALSMNESGMGRSSLAYTRNNLFGHAAYDSDVESNASRYLSVNSSVYSHAKYYVSGTYSHPGRYQYHGSFFGNKASGMNVSYASDPYWGEKAAQYYCKLDEANGNVDFESHKLGISLNKTVTVYNENGYSLYDIKEEDAVFVILDENDRYYKVQTDPTLDEDGKVDLIYEYDLEKNIGYVLKEDIDLTLYENKNTMNYHTVTFDANGGWFRNGESMVSYKMMDGKPCAEIPCKENALFDHWDKELDVINEDTIYKAIYKEVNSIALVEPFNTEYEINERISLENGILEVSFKDDTTKTIPVDTTMISGYDMSKEGNQDVIISYAGKELSIPIHVSVELETKRNSIKENILKVIETGNQLDTLKESMNEYMPYLSFEEIRALDKQYYDYYGDNVQYHLDENELNLGISGLSMALPLEESLNKTWKDIYFVTYHESVEHEKQLEQVALGYEYDIVDTFTLGLKKHFTDVNTDRDIIVSIDKKEGTPTNVMFTVLMVKDGEIIKLKTTQTKDRISFMTNGLGEYMVVSKTSINSIEDENIIETLTLENSDPNKYMTLAYGIGAFVVVLGVGCAIVLKRKKKNDTEENTAINDSLSEDGNKSRADKQYQE